MIVLVAGETDVAFDTAASILPQVRGGRIRALAIARKTRLAEYPNIPTFAEAGLPAYEANAWYSMHAPAGTPPDMVAFMVQASRAAIPRPEAREAARKSGFEIVAGTAEELAARLAAEVPMVKDLVARTGIKPE